MLHRVSKYGAVPVHASVITALCPLRGAPYGHDALYDRCCGNPASSALRPRPNYKVRQPRHLQETKNTQAAHSHVSYAADKEKTPMRNKSEKKVYAGEEDLKNGSSFINRPGTGLSAKARQSRIKFHLIKKCRVTASGIRRYWKSKHTDTHHGARWRRLLPA